MSTPLIICLSIKLGKSVAWFLVIYVIAGPASTCREVVVKEKFLSEQNEVVTNIFKVEISFSTRIMNRVLVYQNVKCPTFTTK